MKLSKIVTTVFGATLLLACGAIAGETNKTTINLADKVTAEGKTIEPGKYQVEWTGSGPNVQVTVAKGKQQVVSFPARLTEQPTANQANAYSTAAAADGTKSLTAIYVGGKKYILELEQASASREAASTSAK
jgi:hypothetical protein